MGVRNEERKVSDKGRRGGSHMVQRSKKRRLNVIYGKGKSQHGLCAMIIQTLTGVAGNDW